MTIPSVNITVEDNGVNTSILLPLQNVQLVMGTAVGGPLLQPFATTSSSSLQQQFVGGQLVEGGGLVTQAGGTIIAMRIPHSFAGTATSPVKTGTGTFSPTVTLDGTYGAFDDYYVEFVCVTGGALNNAGSSGIQFQISLDAGRHFSPVINLPANALTYAIPGTGITLTLGTNSQTIVKGDVVKFATYAPLWNDGGVQSGINAIASSQYALAGWGSFHLVGNCTASDATTFEGYLDNLFSQDIFTRMICTARDAFSPTAWGGSGETETTWEQALATAWGAVSAKRICAGAGFYNMPSAFAHSTYGTVFSYRRPLSWADAVRRVQVPPQRRGGRVRDGSLGNIVVDPSNDPGDGFVYHDERVSPSLDAARFLAAITWKKKQGIFVCHENLMSPTGSQFTDLTLGNVIDVACDIGYQTGVDEISDDLRLNPNGTLYTNDALNIQNAIQGDVDTDMTDAAMISSAVVSVNPNANVGVTGDIPVKISVVPRGYVNSISETIGLAVPNQAPTGGG
jgi:hypothetical protein